MNTEEKAKAYDEALRKIRPLYERAKKEDCPIWSTYEYIFPELAESEDERIRKYLIEELKAAKSVGELKFIIPQPTREECIAYLEKQKEEEGYEAIPVKSTLEYKLGFADGRDFEKQKEQKPVECIEFDNEFEKQVSHLLASVLNGEWEYDEGFVKYAAQSLLGYAKQELKPGWWTATINGEPIPTENKSVDIPLAAWSEEDEDFINMLILHFNYLIDKGGNSVETYKSYREKLKSLRPPFKDREMKLKILKYLSTRCSSLEFEEVEDYLNNLHSFWKPSEEQMDALKEASASWMNQEMGNCELLESLYNDLKKL